ncbi:glycosyltransferase family 2 protein [Marinomonas epiphytica]
MLNIVVPMAGRGSRFAREGYDRPKPLIDVNGKHMIEVVINNLMPKQPHRFIFICQNQHIQDYKLESVFSNSCSDFAVIGIDGITDGAAITVMKARELIDNENPLMIANSDQWVDMDINEYLDDMRDRELDGSMLTMKATDPKWSYAKVGSNGFVTEVVEKVVVSDEATVGVYNFKTGSAFCKYADEMIHKNIRSNGEFYVAPVYTYLADNGGKIGVYNIGSESEGMYGLGIPSDLEYFLCHEVLDRATKF